MSPQPRLLLRALLLQLWEDSRRGGVGLLGMNFYGVQMTSSSRLAMDILRYGIDILVPHRTIVVLV